MILILFIILIRILPFVWIHNPVFWLKNLLFSKKVEIEQFTLHIQSKKVERTKKEGLTSNSRNTKTETVQLASNSLKRVFRRSVRPPVCPLVHVRKKPPVGWRNFKFEILVTLCFASLPKCPLLCIWPLTSLHYLDLSPKSRTGSIYWTLLVNYYI